MAPASRSRPSAARATGWPVMLATVTHAITAAHNAARRRKPTVGDSTIALSAPIQMQHPYHQSHKSQIRDGRAALKLRLLAGAFGSGLEGVFTRSFAGFLGSGFMFAFGGFGGGFGGGLF